MTWQECKREIRRNFQSKIPIAPCLLAACCLDLTGDIGVALYPVFLDRKSKSPAIHPLSTDGDSKGTDGVNLVSESSFRGTDQSRLQESAGELGMVVV